MKFIFAGAVFIAVGISVYALPVLVSLITPPPQNAATFLNDSVIVDLLSEGASPQIVPEADSEAPIFEDIQSNETFLFNDASDGSATDAAIDEVRVFLTTESDGEEAETNEPSVESNTSSENTLVISADSILDTLVGNQAVTRGPTSLTSETDGTRDARATGGGVSVVGDEARRALRARNIMTIETPVTDSADADAVTQRMPYQERDVTLIVASAITKNPDIDTVFFSDTDLRITYFARGRLLFTIPVTYRARLDIDLTESTPARRVRLSFPWYRFFMWTGVSKSALRERIDVIIREPLADDRAYERTTYVFERVATLLETTRGFRGLQ
jgi:hypothetical protein